MAEASAAAAKAEAKPKAKPAEPPSLGDFFAKKKSKVVKGSNLNNAPAAAKAEAKKPKKDAEEDGWEEEALMVPNLKVEVAGKLTRDDDKKEEEESSAPAWKPQKASAGQDLSDRKYPTLAKSVKSSNINLGDNEAKVNIQISANKFASLDNADDDDDEPKRPKEIKPVMVTKKKGERETDAIQREVDKYSLKKPEAAKKEVQDEGSDAENEAEEAAPEPAVVEKKKKDDKKEKKVKEAENEPEQAQEEVEEDLKIQPDLEAAKAKYAGRKKLPKKDIPLKDLQEEKENRPKPKPVKKKGKFADDEDELLGKKKLLVLEE